MTSRSPRTGRRPGTPATQNEILDAARRSFAIHGYAAATLRSIGLDAEVDPSLVLHYFGNKAQLFAAAVTMPTEIVELLSSLAHRPLTHLGEAIATTICELGNDPQALAAWVALIRSATSDPAAATMLREFLGEVVFAPIAARLDRPDAPYRTALVASQVVGLGIARHVLAIEPLASASNDEVIASVAPTLQRYLTGPIPQP